MRDSVSEHRVSHLTDPVVRQTQAHAHKRGARSHSVLMVYAQSLRTQQGTETQCGSLDEALDHLRELITSEVEDHGGPIYDAYGIKMD